jgi:excinuclease ABC subunit B
LAVVDDPTVRNVMVTQDPKLRRAVNRPHKPNLDEMGIATYHEVKPARGGKGERPRKPDLDEMGPGVESIPSRPNSPRSKLGRPGMRGGFKRR